MQYNIFAEYIRSKCDNSIFFCMPSHNGADIGINTSMDITELSFSDNLQYPTTVIKDIENRIAHSYNIPYALIYTAGATSAILSALVVAKSRGNTIIVGSNTHKSVFSLSRVLGLKVLTSPTYSLEDISKNLADQDRICAVVFTSPDYFGKTYSIASALQLSNDFEALLICDQSHGAHFAFSHLLPAPNDKIADITINSWHKTLPVLTGGAVATCKDLNIYHQLVSARANTHTTSPSYMTMASIDSANSRFFEVGEQLYADIYAVLENFKLILSQSYTLEKSDDFTRLVINTKSMKGDYVAKLLERNDIYIEMTYGNLLVLIITHYNYKHLPQLATLLNSIAKDFATKAIEDTTSNSIKAENVFNNGNENNCSTTKKSCAKSGLCSNCKLNNYSDKNINQLIDTDQVAGKNNINDSSSKNMTTTLSLDLWESIGYISAKDVTIYPPGVPILTDGKVITKQLVELLISNTDKILGLNDGKIVCYRRK